MTWAHPGDTWIAAIAALAAVACALPGCFLVLRRLAMMGDAISHAVLPGLAGGFLLVLWASDAGSIRTVLPWIAGADPRHPLVMLTGAIVVGILTAVFTEFLHEHLRTDRGAAMGIVFTSLFALGLIMIRRAADDVRVDLDPACVLYGSLELARLDTLQIAGRDVPRALVTLGGVALLNGAGTAILLRVLRATSFDPAFSQVAGLRPRVAHLLLMTMTAVTAVAAFEAVGTILVVAMIVTPAATAQLLARRLGAMLIVAAAIGVVSAIGGHWAAITVPRVFGFEDTVTSGMIAVVGGVLFALAIVLAPRDGILPARRRTHALGMRILAEDLLGMLYRAEEAGEQLSIEIVRARASAGLDVGPRRVASACARLRRRGHIETADGMFTLTASGRALARSLVRAHRLWESFLVRHAEVPPDHVHRTAMELEHVTDAATARALEDRLGAEALDPHGREIPK